MELIFCDKLGEPFSVFIDFEDLDLIGKYKWHISDAPLGNATRYVSSNRKSLHRVIMNHYFDISGKEIDHIDRNGLNNQKSNLRITDSQGNKRNRSNFGEVGFVGVWKIKLKSGAVKFQTAIKPNSDTKQIKLGRFDDAQTAAEIYDVCALYYFKEFAHLNFPEKTSEYSEFIIMHKDQFNDVTKLKELFYRFEPKHIRLAEQILKYIELAGGKSVIDLVNHFNCSKGEIANALKPLVKTKKLKIVTQFRKSQRYFIYSLYDGTPDINATKKYDVGTEVVILHDHNKRLKGLTGVVIGRENKKIIVAVKFEADEYILKKANTAITLKT